MFKKIVLVVAVGALALTACKSGAKGSSDVVAKIDGEAITAAQLDEAVASEMSRLSSEIYAIKKDGLDRLIEEKLLKKAADEKKMSVDDFIDKETAASVTPVTDEEIKAFYEARKAQAGGKSFDEMKEPIRNFLTQSRKQAARSTLMTSIRDKYKVETFIEPPRTEVSIGDAYTKGSKDALVTIIEYSDFQCPYCGRARATVDQILSTYGDKVQYAFKDFPLSFHKLAQEAHEASYCAGDQEKYWEYNKVLFENQRALETTHLKNYAKTLGLDMAAFDKCLDGHQYAERVQKNQMEGASVGVTGTPAYFINGIPLSGARPFQDFKAIIDDELNRK